VLSATLGNGPYGPGTNFNVAAPSVSGTAVIYTFVTPLASDDYFVFINGQGGLARFINFHTVNGFWIDVSFVPNITGHVFVAVL
jgi:hypothetical protein